VIRIRPYKQSLRRVCSCSDARSILPTPIRESNPSFSGDSHMQIFPILCMSCNCRSARRFRRPMLAWRSMADNTAIHKFWISSVHMSHPRHISWTLGDRFPIISYMNQTNYTSNEIPVYSSSASAISDITLKIMAGGSSGSLSGDSFRIRLATLITEKCYSSANPDNELHQSHT
jgi:hypothetical protein